MRPLAERQGDFAAALLNPALPIPHGLVGPDGEPSLKRFAVYRNNVVASLIEALKDGFPAVRRLVGDEFFCAMARAYVAVEPPRSPILLEYGAGFADFIRTFEPAAALPYLADVARIERAWAQAYHAPEASPIAPEVFTTIAPDQLPAIRLALHPSLRLVRSQFPALTIWWMNVGDGIPAPVDLAAGGEDVLIVRPLADVEVRSIPRGSFEFIQALADGEPVLPALQAALIADPRFDLAANLTDLMCAGALVGYGLAPDRR
ncbi:putative DNA-binding domain-containing protein [Bradyrhizobium sp. ISRA443]|uniref:HvfC/BufC N-terminal domain-containing protein n=1 Tax=unclassified Bradyrhizobium TaxID=2631580 RepID=UPI0024798809|nr:MULTISPECIES: DNA-binding domain-containing protein [unclassified Bradyrhizobium]WGR98649.1 putative DNA-binding domain-containing protein [Bradyrhizobium sp. ISRA436]WGS05538.1 putative DNA-binding domain-containing protein [Bradyrhizobium sp. ISRA437]WGS12425.1 putative DNA-binding domain-containing protein [Bradyrhizobium sp. ISRA443]